VARGNVERWDRWAPRYDRGVLKQVFFRRLYGRLIDEVSAKPGERVLDVGSGTGSVVSMLAGRGVLAFGADPSIEMTRVASDKAPGRFVVAAAERLPIRASTLDAAMTSLSMHHWDEAERGLLELARVLRPGGRALVADVERRGLAGVFANLYSIVTRDHAHYLSGKELSSAMESAGFRPKRQSSFRRRIMLLLAERR
jgi:ubiquinone/menaquinone biosynthesis C-methylase UbiE